MEKYVVDTNVLIASIPQNSDSNWIWQSIINGEFTICVTTDILMEYEEILSRFFNPFFANYIMSIFDQMPNIERVTNNYHWNLIAVDPDDNKFVDCAINSNAKCIVSEDKHFKVLHTISFPKVHVLKINEFKIYLGKI